MHSDSDNRKSQSRLIVKIKPNVRVKMPSRVYRQKRPSHVRVKATPSYVEIKKQARHLQDSSSSQDLVNVPLLGDDSTSNNSIIEDDSVSEIIALLERARSRSQNFIENEGVHEQASKTKEARTKQRPEKYY
jgi:hypothetical protein